LLFEELGLRCAGDILRARWGRRAFILLSLHDTQSHAPIVLVQAVPSALVLFAWQISRTSPAQLSALVTNTPLQFDSPHSNQTKWQLQLALALVRPVYPHYILARRE
jgi:hypothetical protein